MCVWKLTEFPQKCQNPAWCVLWNKQVFSEISPSVHHKFLQISCSLGAPGVVQPVQALCWEQFQPTCLEWHIQLGKAKPLFSSFLPGPDMFHLPLGPRCVWALWSGCLILFPSPLTPFYHKLGCPLEGISMLPRIFFGLGCRICFFPLMMTKRSLWRDWILKLPHYQELIQNVYKGWEEDTPQKHIYRASPRQNWGISSQVLVV